MKGGFGVEHIATEFFWCVFVELVYGVLGFAYSCFLSFRIDKNSFEPFFFTLNLNLTFFSLSILLQVDETFFFSSF